MAKTAIEEIKKLNKKVKTLMPDQVVSLRKKDIILMPFTLEGTERLVPRVSFYTDILAEPVEDTYDDEVTDSEGNVTTVKKTYKRMITDNEFLKVLLGKLKDVDNGLLADLKVMILAACDEITADELNSLRLDEFAIILETIVEMNVDFFGPYFQGIFSRNREPQVQETEDQQAVPQESEGT